MHGIAIREEGNASRQTQAPGALADRGQQHLRRGHDVLAQVVFADVETFETERFGMFCETQDAFEALGLGGAVIPVRAVHPVAERQDTEFHAQEASQPNSE